MLRLARCLEPAAYHCFKTCGVYRAVRFNSSQTSKKYDPLNILFCGSDHFSIYSLRALWELQQLDPEKIKSIEVLCRPDKRVGRGLKEINHVPIKRIANKLGLKLHQVDDFKCWNLTPSINLIVAVSFGLLVPVRILEGAKYGGLNVHPSLLPDLRGPAPLTHTLLKQRPHTGVTLQTMHPTRFDHGIILDQTPPQELPTPSKWTPYKLVPLLGPQGAKILRDGIDKGLFVPPVVDISEGVAEPEHLDHAPKITPEDRHINWNTWTADEIILRGRVLDRLWDTQTYRRCVAGKTKRVVFDGPWTKITESEKPNSGNPGDPVDISVEDLQERKLCIRTCDGQLVSPAAVTVDGGKKGGGLRTLKKGLRKFSRAEAHLSGRNVAS